MGGSSSKASKVGQEPGARYAAEKSSWEEEAASLALLPGDDVEAALETKSDSRRPSKAAPKYDKNGRLIKPVAVAEPKF